MTHQLGTGVHAEVNELRAELAEARRLLENEKLRAEAADVARRMREACAEECRASLLPDASVFEHLVSGTPLVTDAAPEPNRMDAPSGPECFCGRPSVYQDGSCNLHVAQARGAEGVSLTIEPAMVPASELEVAREKIAELEAKLRVSLEQFDAVSSMNAENVRLRAKCSRQRKELRRWNYQGQSIAAELRGYRNECRDIVGRLVRATSFPDDANLTDILEAIETAWPKLMTELAALRQREEPESVAKRYYIEGWNDGSTTPITTKKKKRDLVYYPPAAEEKKT